MPIRANVAAILGATSTFSRSRPACTRRWIRGSVKSIVCASQLGITVIASSAVKSLSPSAGVNSKPHDDQTLRFVMPTSSKSSPALFISCVSWVTNCASKLGSRSMRIMIFSRGDHNEATPLLLRTLEQTDVKKNNSIGNFCRLQSLSSFYPALSFCFFVINKCVTVGK